MRRLNLKTQKLKTAYSNTACKLCDCSSERNSNLNNPLKKDHMKVKSQNSETEDSTQHVNYVTTVKLE